MNKEQCLAKVQEAVIKANKVFPSINYQMPNVTWFNRSKCAGIAKIHYNEIGFNTDIMFKTSEIEFEQTIVHEICHRLQKDLYPNAKQAHGPEWKWIMQKMGKEPLRCHNFDVSEAKKNSVKKHIYNCTCGKEFKLSTTMHNKIRRGSTRICMSCRNVINFTGKVVAG